MSREKGFNEIGKRLHSVRGEMDQRGFSRLVNVSQQAISNYERGNLPASWGFLRRLIEDFNVNLNWLFSGQGLRDHRAGTPYASLADNRPPGWPVAFVDQVAFADANPLEILLPLYFLYLATEPADAKSRLMADIQAIVDAQRQRLEPLEGAAEARLLVEALDSLASDDRRRAAAALIAVGERIERDEREAMRRARRAYFAVLGLARLQGWVELEVEAARRVGRTYRKEGNWSEAESFFAMAISRFEPAAEHGQAPGNDGPVSPESAARTFMGFGHVAKHKGAAAEARDRYTAALSWALKSQDTALRAEVYLDLAALAIDEKEWQKALDFITTGRAFAEQTTEPRLAASFKVLEARVLRGRGELEAAEAILRFLLQRAEASRDLPGVDLASTNLGEVLVDRGATDEALDLLRRTARAAEEHGDTRDLALRKLLMARIAAAKGEEGVVRTRFLDALCYARDHGLTREFEEAALAFERAGSGSRSRTASQGG